MRNEKILFCAGIKNKNKITKKQMNNVERFVVEKFFYGKEISLLSFDLNRCYLLSIGKED